MSNDAKLVGPVLVTPKQVADLQEENAALSKALADAGRALQHMQETKPALYEGDRDSDSAVHARGEWYKPTPSGKHSRKVFSGEFNLTWKHGAAATGLIAGGTVLVKSIDWIFEAIKHAIHFHGG